MRRSRDALARIEHPYWWYGAGRDCPRDVPSIAPKIPVLPPGALPNFSLIPSVTNANSVWTFGHAFRQGDLPTGNYITTSSGVIDPAHFYADIRNLWPDGSTKYAVLSGVSNLTANTLNTLQLAATQTAPSGASVAEPTSLANTNVVLTPGTGSFPIAAGGTYAINSVLGVDRSTWSFGSGGRVRQILGPVMSEFHYYQPTSDAHLTIWWFVRAYSTGAIEIEVVFENGWLNVASPSEKDYSATININGTAVGTFPNLLHFSHSRWSAVYWYSGGASSTPQHNPLYLRATRMVPNFVVGTPDSGAWTGLVSALNPTPFALGNWTTPMGNVGYQAAIGLLPQWESLYCTSADSRAYAATISNYRGCGRWSMHYRDETTGRPVIYTSYPTNAMPLDGWGNPFPSAAGGTNAWDIPHHPSYGYLPYLIEGRYTQLEALQMSASFNILDENPAVREAGGFAGIIACVNSPMTTRGAAWAWRTAGQAAAVSPRLLMGSTPPTPDMNLTNAFVGSISDTAAWNNQNFVLGTLNSGSFKNSIGWLGQYDSYGTGPSGTEWWGASWMVSFQGMALAHIADLGIEGLSNPIDLYAIRDFSANNVILVSGDETTWNFRRAGNYDRPYLTGSSNPAAPIFEAIPSAFASFKAQYGLTTLTANSGDPLMDHGSNAVVLNPDPNQNDTSNTGDGYWALHISVLSRAVDNGAPGAVPAYNIVAAANNFNPTAQGANDRPQFALAPAVLPAFVPSVGTFENISSAPNGLMSSVDPCPAKTCVYSEENGQEGVFVLWNGCAWAPNYSPAGAVLFHGGGHQGYGGNEAYAFDLTTRTWIRHKVPSPYNEPNYNADGEYPDGQPFPPHMYGGLGYLPPPYGGTKGALIRLGFAGAPVTQHMYKMVLSDTPLNDTWVRWGPAPLTETDSYNACVWDTRRHQFWVLGGGNSNDLISIDTNGNISAIANTGTNVDSQVGIAYSHEFDFLVALGTAGGISKVWGRFPSAASGTYFAQLNTTGTFPQDPSRNGIIWSRTLGCFVQYDGNGATYVNVLKPPPGAAPDLLNGTWTWSQQTLTGAAGATPVVGNYGSGYNGNWGRFIEIPYLRTFLYTDGASNPVQMWRLNGMALVGGN